MRALIAWVQKRYRLRQWRKKLCRSFPEPQAYMTKILEIELDAYGQGYVDGIAEKKPKFVSLDASPFGHLGN